MSRNVAGAKVKACWGKDTIWAILSNLWNHEFSSYQQVLGQNLLPSGVKAGTKTDDATRSGPNMFQLKRIPVLDLSPTGEKGLEDVPDTTNLPQPIDFCRGEWATAPMSR